MRSMLTRGCVCAALLLLLDLVGGCAPPPEPPPLARLDAVLAVVSPGGALRARDRARLPDEALMLVVTPSSLDVVAIGSFSWMDAGREDDELSVSAHFTRPLHLDMVDGAFDEKLLRGQMVEPLYESLVERAETWKNAAAAVLGPEFPGVMWLLVDRRVEFSTLRGILYSAGQAQFGDYRIVPFGSPAGPEPAPQPRVEDDAPRRPGGRGMVMGSHVSTPTKRTRPLDRLRVEPRETPRFAVDDTPAVVKISVDLGESSTMAGPSLSAASLYEDGANPRLYASFADAAADASHPVLPSVEQLLHVSKRTDDRLMAAIDRHAEPGRMAWTEQAARAAWARGAADDRAAATWLAGAAVLAGQPIQGWGLDAGAVASAQAQADAFRKDPLRARPLGVWGEADDLGAVFQRDRRWMQALDMRRSSDAAAARGLKALLDHDDSVRAALEQDLALRFALTNPAAHPGIVDFEALPERGKVALVPASRSRETQLVEAMGGAVGPSSMELFISAIRSGDVSLVPTADSGWYDHQQWALGPLLAPDEAGKLEVNAGYRERLEQAFKAAMAMRRETHVKSLSLPSIGALAPVALIVKVAPDLRVEPLPTHYARSAEAYEFLENEVLDPHLGDAYATLADADGPLPVAVAGARDRYRAAAALARVDLGLPVEGDAPAAAAETAQWLAHWYDDPAMSEDVRFMVPVGQDGSGNTVAWGVLGVRTINITAEYTVPPTVSALDPEVTLDVSEVASHYTLVVPVFSEFVTPEPLDRAAFRALADGYPMELDLVDALAPPVPEVPAPATGCGG